MPNRKISELTLATSSLTTDGLIIQRGGSNFKIEAGNFTAGSDIDTGSLLLTSSIAGTTITFTRADGTTYTNEIVSASYAITASHEVVHEVSSSYAETASFSERTISSSYATTSSHAISASHADLADEAISSSYAISASHAEVSDEAISASYALTASHAASTAGTLSNGTSVDAFSFDGSTDVTVDISTYSASAATDLTALSSSTATANTNLSSSASTAREELSDGTLITASISANILTFTKGDSTTFDLNLNTGSVNSASYAETASLSFGSVGTLSNGTSVDAFTFNGSGDATVDISTYSASAATDLTNLSSSASTAREALATDIENQSSSFASDRVMRAGDTMTDILTINKTGDGVTDGDLPLSIIGTGLIIGDRTGETRTFPNGQVIQFRDYGNVHWRMKASASTFAIEQNSGGGNDGAYITFPQVGKDVQFAGKLTNVTDPTEPQDALTKNYYDTTSGSFVRSVNGTNPDSGGNVAIALASVDTGTSASMLAKSSSGGFVDGDVWIISGQSGSGTGSDASGSNGDSYIYSSASGELLEISPLDQAASDQRYVNRSGDTMQGGLILTGDPSIANEAANKNYVDTLSGSANTARTNLSSSASTARDAIASDLDIQSSSFASDRLMRAGDTMTGPLSMSGNDVLLGNGGGMRSDAGAFIGTGAGGATLQVNGGTADAFQFVVRNPTNSSDFLLAVTSSGGGYRTRFYRDLDASGNLVRNVADPLADQDAVTKNYLDTTTGSYVQTVNGNSPDGTGNVTVALASTSTGLSSSFPASPDDADVYIISGETATDRTASNGEIFIYSTASSEWYQITSPDQTANDERYVLVSGDTMTGKLVADQGASSTEGINIEANAGNEAALGFLQKTVAQSFLVQESSSPYALRYTSGDKTSLRNIHVATPTATTHATTKAYVDGAFVELSGDTMTGNLTIGHPTPQLILNDTTDVNGAAYIEFRGTGTATGRVGMKSSSDDHLYIEALRNNGQIRLTPTGTGLVRVQGPAFEAMRVVRTAGSGGCVIVTENTSGDEVTFGTAQTGNGFIETATGVLQVANTGGTARVALVATPTADSDAATKGYVDGLLGTTITGAIWSTSGTASTLTNGNKVSFNEASARQTVTNDNTQVSWSTTNNEFALSEGTWHIVFDYRKDTQTNTSVRFFQIQYKTTAGTGTGGGTLIDAAPTINNTTSGGEKVHMEAFLTVPASTTYYVFFYLASGGNTGGRFQKAVCRRID
jgi:hypothetical protein